MNINCVAVDDEPIALDVIQHHCSKIPFINLKATIKSAFEAIDYLQKEKVDLIFLDIQMPELTGFEFLKSLPVKPLVVFTTAYPSYALESYEVDAVDYLVKPIPFDRFLKAVNKVRQKLNFQSDGSQEVNQAVLPNFIFVKTEYKTVKIFLEDILYIESVKDYVAFHLKNEVIMSLLSIKSVEAFLPKEQFVRVHRSFIVAFDKIEEIERNNIIIGKKMIPVGESYREYFKLLIEGRKL